MKSRWLGTWFAALTLAFISACASAQPYSGPPQLQAGREFNRLEPPRPVATGSRIEVIEFFYYGCSICYEAQPALSRWLVTAPEYVAFRMVPVVSADNWEPFAKLFYTIEALGQIGRLHWPIYDNFHFDGLKLNDDKVMLEWVTRNGVDGQKFSEFYASPEIRARVDQARKTVEAYDVRGVPTFVIDGKYVTSARLAGGTKQMMNVVDELVKRARRERPN